MEDPTSTPRIIRDLVGTLEQGRQLVASLSDLQYGQAPEAIEASSIGAHYRHHLEHVSLLVRGQREGLVDYDARGRDERVERSREVALALTDELMGELLRWDEAALDEPLRIAHRTCPEEGPCQAPSTLRRELLFLISHAVHHYALMKLVAEALGHRLDETFGVMPSTLAHQAAQRHRASG